MKIDGREIAHKIFEDLKIKVKKLQERNIIPNLAIILVGDDPASIAYINQKKIKAEKINAKTSIFRYPNSVSEKDLLSHLNDLNHLSGVHGIIVQQPLPSNIAAKKITSAISPNKDLDGFNVNSKFQSPISLAVMKILGEIYRLQNRRQACPPKPRSMRRRWDHELNFDNWLKTKKIVIIGKGETGGKPIINTLQKLGVEPLIIDSKTLNPQDITKTADIIVSAVGKENIINSKMIKKGVILISVGLHKDRDGKLHGDYEEKEIKNIASFYTPTPGGVGPINVAMLLENLITASESTN